MFLFVEVWTSSEEKENVVVIVFHSWKFYNNSFLNYVFVHSLVVKPLANVRYKIIWNIIAKGLLSLLWLSIPIVNLRLYLNH